jgi:hypothetical protein
MNYRNQIPFSPWLLFAFMAIVAVSFRTGFNSTGAVTPTAPLTSPQAAPATPVPWTAVASTGAVDELSATRYAFTNLPNTCVEYRSTTTSLEPIDVYYNVVNTFDNGAPATRPGWTMLELGAVAPGGSVVEATLFRVSNCTGAQEQICQVRILNSASATCKRCQPFSPSAIDFANNLYYVHLKVDRNATTEKPRACTLRILKEINQ